MPRGLCSWRLHPPPPRPLPLPLLPPPPLPLPLHTCTAHPSDPAPEKNWRVITGPSGSRTRPAARLNLPPPLTGPRIKPTGGSGCEDAQLAGLSCHPARHDGVWTGPVHTPPAPSGLSTAVVCGHRRGGEDRGRGCDDECRCDVVLMLLLAAAALVIGDPTDSPYVFAAFL